MCKNELTERFSKIHNKSFLSELKKTSNKLVGGSDYINEIFLYFYINVFEITRVLSLENVKCFESDTNSDKKFYLWIAASISSGIKMPFRYRSVFYIKSIFYFISSFFIVLITSLLLPIYVLFKFSGMKLKQANKNYQSLAIIRAPATYSKMQFLEEKGVLFLTDDITYSKDNIESLYTFDGGFSKIFSLTLVPVYSLFDFFKIFMDAKNTVGIGLSGYVLHFYARRIAHKCNFEVYLNALMKNGQIKTYYTGNKEDRFALLEKRLCEKYKIPCVCIPHGLEYAYKMPRGLVGGDFYCTSANAKNYLAKLYKGQSITFHFDEKIAEKMFARNIKNNKKRNIVFFPESREPEDRKSVV